MPRIDTEEELQKRVKRRRIESIAVAFAVVVLTMYDRGFPYILRLAENGPSFYRLRRRFVSASIRDCEAGLQKSDKEEVEKKSS